MASMPIERRSPNLAALGSRSPGLMATLVLAAMLFGSGLAVAQPPITALAVTPDQQSYVVGSQAGIRVHRLSDHKLVKTIDTELENVHDLAYSPDSQYLLAAGGSPGQSGSVELFRWPTQGSPQHFEVSGDLLYRVSWLDDSQSFATCGQDKVCRLINMRGETTASYSDHSQPVLAVKQLTKTRQLMSAGIDNTIQLWSYSGQRQKSLDNHTHPVTDLEVLADSDSARLRVISTSEDGTVRLWQPEIGRMVKFLRLASIPRCVAWHRENRIFVGCDNGKVCEIEIDEMKIVREFQTNIRPIYELAATKEFILSAGVGGVEAISH